MRLLCVVKKLLFSPLLFMRSSSFWFTTIAVVVLHWAALHNLPWSQAAAATPATPFLQTRTITQQPALPQPATASLRAAEPAAPPVAASAPVSTPKATTSAAQHKKTRATAPKASNLDTAAPVSETQPNDASAAESSLAEMVSALESNAGDALPTDVAEMPAADAPAPDLAAAPADQDAAVVVADATPASPTATTPEKTNEPAAVDAQRGPGVELVKPGSDSNRAQQKPLDAQWPAPKRLLFDVSGQAKKFNYSASAALTWQHDGVHYQAEQKISAFLVGQRIQRSVGDIQGALLAPVRFSDKSRSEKAAHFNQSTHMVTFSSNAPSAPLDVGAQDRLSVFIQLAAWLKAAPERFGVGSTITLTTVSASKADRWAFRVEGLETLDLPAGATPTIKLQRLPREQYDQKAELWLAPAIDYLPARIRLTQTNGDFADLKLNGFESP